MYIIGIAGGTGSGKTTVVKKIIEALPTDKVGVIPLDSYYNDTSHLSMDERKKINFDHPKAFDWKLMVEQIRELKNGKAIEKPIYDFTIHGRSEKTEIVEPKELILVEGIMALVNKDLRALGDLKVYINASRERRLVRRIERDQKERGRTYESIIEQYFSTVLPMYEEIIAPSQYYADLIINNDGITTRSIEVLVSVLNTMMLSDKL